MCQHCRNFPTITADLPTGWLAKLQSPFTCTEATDRAGMPVNRAITVHDTPTVPVVRLCPGQVADVHASLPPGWRVEERDVA